MSATKKVSNFKDWAGQYIPYRLVPCDDEDGNKVACEIDPHKVSEWTSFGRGKTNEEALKSATEAWNAFDNQKY